MKINETARAEQLLDAMDPATAAVENTETCEQ